MARDPSRDPVHLHLHIHGCYEGRPVELFITVPLTRVFLGLCLAVPSTVLTVFKLASTL